MSEHLYKENFYDTNTKRADIVSEMSGIEAELVNKPAIPAEQLVDGIVKLVASLDFTDKKSIISKLVTKIEATKQEVTVWGRIPIPATEQVGYYANDSDTRDTTQHNSDRQVGLDAKHWHHQLATIPFSLSFEMPPLDKRTRGYLPKYIKELQTTVGGEW